MKKTSPAHFHRYFPVSRRDRNWGLYVTTAGESQIAPGAVYPPDCHPEGYAFDWQHGRILHGFAMVYVSKGRGTFEAQSGVSASVEAGHVMLLFPDVWHRYRPVSNAGWHEHWIGFDGEIARHWMKDRDISTKNPVIKIRAEEVVFGIFSRVLQAMRANVPALQQVLAGATADLIGLLYSTRKGGEAGPQTSDVIERAISRVHEEYARNLNVKILAQELGVGYSWFRSTFAAHTGMSPHQYLLEYRIVRARNLLAESNFSVKEIATRTGFEDEHYFSRLFRSRLDLTPTQWRRRHRSLFPVQK